MAATPNMPADFQVHHILEQGREVIAERFKKERNVDVHALDNLRGMPAKQHGEISAIQTKWWAAQAKKYGSLKSAYEMVPLDEVLKLQESIDGTFAPLWIKAKATQKQVAAVQKNIANELDEVGKLAQRKGPDGIGRGNRAFDIHPTCGEPRTREEYRQANARNPKRP